jgi:hypothetical protein
MIVSFIFLGEPVGLGATLIVASVILGRAGPWWRREPAPPLIDSRQRLSGLKQRARLQQRLPNCPICDLSSALNSCSVLESDLCQIAPKQ